MHRSFVDGHSVGGNCSHKWQAIIDNFWLLHRAAQGFEDCEVFNELMEKHHENLDETLAEYAATRAPNVKAIADLALYNYIEVGQLAYNIQ